MSTVYRVEDPSLIGPYSGSYAGNTTVRMRDDHNNGPASLHPSPYTSWQIRMGTQPLETRCAFDSMQSLFRWFGGWLPGMIREGFHISAIDDVQVTAGPDDVGQVLFIDKRKRKGRK